VGIAQESHDLLDLSFSSYKGRWLIREIGGMGDQDRLERRQLVRELALRRNLNHPNG
jgi:hypothetical protein